jgi:NhaA family Na+:H+ antiporter
MTATIRLLNGFIVPFRNFIKKSTSGAILLLCSAVLALLIANSGFNEPFKALLDTPIAFSIGSLMVNKPLILWINDGLMSIFFFVVGLELKREIMAGELANPKNVVMPIVGAVGGMLVPALIYILINQNASDDALNGWGIPMATDIAFALGVLYLLGPKVPIQLKVFLTALAIIDDIGAVSVVAFFYTSDISVNNLMLGFFIFSIMALANFMGVRNVTFYAILGIGGLWLAFLLSGVHATIAAVLAAFTIPANRKVNKIEFTKNIQTLVLKYSTAKSEKNERYLASLNECECIKEIEVQSTLALSPLQRLENSLHGFVLFVVMPIFALANAGVTFDGNWFNLLSSNVSLGIIFGLLLGKIIGIFGFSMLGYKLGFYQMPDKLNGWLVLGASFLAAIGFTMSLFITSLAFESEIYYLQAKMGILTASLIAGVLGYFIIKHFLNQPEKAQKMPQ